MEKKKVKLSLNKETVAKLSNGEMYGLKGGTQESGYSCYTPETCNSVCVWTCAVTCICTKETGTCC
jgi:hypothetical protein